MRKTIRAIVIFVASVLVGLMLGVAPASAEVKSDTIVSYGTASVQDEVTVTAIATSDVAGKVNLEYENPNPMTYKGKCPKVKKVTKKLLKQKSCFRLKKGVKFTNSGRDRAGKLVKYRDKTKSRTTFVKLPGKKKAYKKLWRKNSCGNKVWFKKKRPKLKVSQVHLVRQFDASVTVKVTANANVTAKADAWCKSESSSASASAMAIGTANASAMASASANTKAEATANAAGAVRASVRDRALASAKAEASAKATADATAKAVCTESTPSLPPPPVTPPPSLLETDTINDVVVDNTRTILVSGNVPSGHTATLFASAKNGGTITENKTQEVSGSFSVKVTYLAPDEVPASGTDWVVFTLTQDDSQADDVETNKFVITPRPVDPL